MSPLSISLPPILTAAIFSLSSVLYVSKSISLASSTPRYVRKIPSLISFSKLDGVVVAITYSLPFPLLL